MLIFVIPVVGEPNVVRLDGTREKLTVHNHGNREQTHKTALGIVHVEAIPEPLLGLAANLALETLTVTRGHQVWCKVVTQVLADRSALGQDDRLLERRCGNSHQRRLAERVDSLKLGRCELVGLSLVHLDGVAGVLGAFFKQPDDALGARLLEPVVPC